MVKGWARTIRDSKAFAFIELNDGSYFKSVQIVVDREKLQNYEEIVSQNVGCAFIVEGVVLLTPELIFIPIISGTGLFNVYPNGYNFMQLSVLPSVCFLLDKWEKENKKLW